MFGTGLRYWTTGRNPEWFQPPQVFLEVLATAGLVGLAGFLFMMGGMIKVLLGVPGLTGSVALALVISRLVQGQLDIFWLSPTTAVPFLLAGVCLGVIARDRTKETSASGALVMAR